MFSTSTSVLTECSLEIFGLSHSSVSYLQASFYRPKTVSLVAVNSTRYLRDDTARGVKICGIADTAESSIKVSIAHLSHNFVMSSSPPSHGEEMGINV